MDYCTNLHVGMEGNKKTNPRSNEINNYLCEFRNNLNPVLLRRHGGYLHFLPKIDIKRVSFFLGTGARVGKMSDFFKNILKYCSIKSISKLRTVLLLFDLLVALLKP